MSILKNYIDGRWSESVSKDSIPVYNPATQEVLAHVPSGPDTTKDVDRAAKAAQKAYKEWSKVPVMKRVQVLYHLKTLLEDNREALAEIITKEAGKTRAESLGEIQRAIENVEVACGTPMLMAGDIIEDIATGIDEMMIRQPLGVSACITPFNFPGMIVFWFLPYAIATGNAFIVKPSEKVPMTMMKIFELLDQLDLPAGLVSLVHGGKESVDALLEHPIVKGISFVGSTPVARYIYSKGTANGKRVQAQGGAKNPVVVLPDADIEMSSKIIADSVYGCAGQRCLAASTIITVGDDKGVIKDALYETVKTRTTGYGLEDVDMGPVITAESKNRIEGLIQKGVDEGATPLLDGRNTKISGYEKGNFLTPTILENVALDKELIKTEIFGPVMSLVHMKNIEEALQFVNNGSYGNMACLFTTSGANARKFRNEADAGNIGINIGVAAPMAQFPFSGWKDSFFGDLHGQGKHAIEFFTQTKVVIERWPNIWSRKF
ncbi:MULTISPECIES: CoA-acylating methylmalonate-semialdehyde dehydrogenase [Flagellimonas]|uniref:methylmalonate-semialdehyde dehydrogenase (CoA acylating) n=1 Tax=Flagellimonas hadalis TaxID=2597517 RepID=A0A5N5J1I2_9FLAO|nr:CoA-acylating methylmalonate-semialdehyde dehydrogenase [Allomuricauda hadalis]KAB5486118.1 CoA-acylating methylmalonate-semialdehyde dehydrogenase [Allomuricauda hadalis]RUA15212.1 MAG: methylmalonate-semialdehyde dehydrogenase (CoA acylating) [Flavobacteriia bacterium]